MAVNDFGSDYSAFNKDYTPSVPRSLFDKSQLHSFTTDFAIIKPFYLEYTVPKSDYDISFECLIKSLALVHPPLTRVRYFVHFYYQKMNDLWHQFDNFVTLGNTGRMDIEPPRLGWSSLRRLSLPASRLYAAIQGYRYYPSSHGVTVSGSWGLYFPSHSGPSGSLSLFNDFGLPCPISTTLTNWPSDGTDLSSFTLPDDDYFVDAFPFAMYQSIYRNYYYNFDMAISGSFVNSHVNSWQPLDLHNFALVSGPNCHMRHDLYPYDTSFPSQDATDLFTERLRDWRSDYFTSAKLWPQRGNPPELSFDASSATPLSLSVSGTSTLDSGQSVPVKVYGYNGSSFVTVNPGINPNADISMSGTTFHSVVSPWPSSGNNSPLYATNDSSTQGHSFPRLTGTVTGTATGSSSFTFASSITVQKLAQLEIINMWQQRNGFTNGTYNAIIRAQFGINPHHETFAPVYIGGTSGNITFTEVLNSTAGGQSGDVPLGEQGGHAITVSGSRIGHVHSNDYGMIMGVISIMPDTMYHQGIPREFQKETYADYYYPLFNGLGPQEVKMSEIYATYKTADDSKPFGFQGRFDEMRYKPNIVSGKLADLDDEYWKAWTLVRHFSSAPTLGYTFLSAKDVRHDSWAYSGEPPFIVQTATRVRAVLPMPSQAPMVTI